jgi:hypothetical protein
VTNLRRWSGLVRNAKSFSIPKAALPGHLPRAGVNQVLDAVA